MITSDQLRNEIIILAKELSVKPRVVQIRDMKRKLGSCSSRGRLTFAKKLLNESIEVRYKVIIHELLHLRYPSHNKMFRYLNEAYLIKLLPKN